MASGRCRQRRRAEDFSSPGACWSGSLVWALEGVGPGVERGAGRRPDGGKSGLAQDLSETDQARNSGRLTGWDCWMGGGRMQAGCRMGRAGIHHLQSSRPDILDGKGRGRVKGRMGRGEDGSFLCRRTPVGRMRRRDVPWVSSMASAVPLQGCCDLSRLVCAAHLLLWAYAGGNVPFWLLLWRQCRDGAIEMHCRRQGRARLSGGRAGK